ncbi:MAG: DUF4326 domain-containing protein [Acidobacteria bacterium]|nr:DUF4326 domain-containing protein [Acidobacteriota bacterium]
MITIKNKKTYRGDGIYIGRPSVLGNPYTIGKDGTREEVIQRYRDWLWRQIKLRGEVYRELQRLVAKAKAEDLILICWCKQPDRPIDCHGDVVKRAVEYLDSIDS